MVYQLVGSRFKKRFYMLLTITLFLMLVVLAISLVIPGPAWAEPTATLEISGDGVARPVVLTLAELTAMEQYEHVQHHQHLANQTLVHGSRGEAEGPVSPGGNQG